MLRGNSASGKQKDSCRVFERESIRYKKQNNVQERAQSVGVHTQENLKCRVPFSVLQKYTNKARNLINVYIQWTAMPNCFVLPYITVYTFYLMSLLLFSLVIFFSLPQCSQFRHLVNEAGTVTSLQLPFSDVGSMWLISLGCFQRMQHQSLLCWKGIYAVAPGSAARRISGHKDSYQLSFSKENRFYI